jgi:hypothetical protein
MDIDDSLRLKRKNNLFHKKLSFMNTKDNLKLKNLDNIFIEQTFFIYFKITQEINNINSQNNKNFEGIKFWLLQSIKDKDQINRMLFEIAEFYNNNFIGNKDFIHIPTFREMLDNFCFPILIATRKDKYGKDEILGTTTIKFENNTELNDNPYFPNKNETVISINGILTKMDLKDANGERIKGIGKELFKIAIKGAYEINKFRPVRLMCKIDCRNDKSVNSIANAAEGLKEYNINPQVYINGYYELQDSKDYLLEAPTFTVEVSFNDNKFLNDSMTNFSYVNCKRNNLYSSIYYAIKCKTEDVAVYINKDDDKKVVYHQIKPISLSTLRLETGDSIVGNERIPFANSFVKING